MPAKKDLQARERTGGSSQSSNHQQLTLIVFLVAAMPRWGKKLPFISAQRGLRRNKAICRKIHDFFCVLARIRKSNTNTAAANFAYARNSDIRESEREGDPPTLPHLRRTAAIPFNF